MKDTATHFYFIIFLLAILLIHSCKEKDNDIPTDPSNLVVEVTISTVETGKVAIQAHAENTIEYRLYVDSENEPVASNNNGTFEHLFTKSGAHLIDVRAYGSSGRYIKEEREILIGDDDTVSIDMGYITPISYPGLQMVWNDEFNSDEVNTDNWSFETGTGCPDNCGWGNNELEYYRKENASVYGGTLVIEARKENYLGSNYTSARLKTSNKRSFQYGRVDIRALLPEGQGMWPALWMLGNNIQTVGWPQCGETDIMEMVGGSGRENTVHGVLHWDYNGHVQAGGQYTLPTGIFADEYHVFSIIWNENTIRWLMNDIQFYVIDITPSHMSEYHQPGFFIFNLAVGGNWPGNPNATTVFPQRLKVDYIRVFQ